MTKREGSVLHDLSAGLRVPPGDYVADGLLLVVLDALFPNMIVGDKENHPWPYLRREVAHNWYCDRRYPEVGFLNRDEVILLYNLALQFSGRPGLEIGCWMGWSTCHLALAGLQLDVVDPVLTGSEHEASVRYALERGKVAERVRLFRTRSPQAVDQLAQTRGEGWNFFFIDGDHEASAPERDARVCLQYAADDALFVLHDLVSPDVEKGLAVLAAAGFKTQIYETMQIVGIAWRGNVKPVKHIPDPAQERSLPPHLLKYQVAGESPGIRAERMAGLLRIAGRKSRNATPRSRRLHRPHGGNSHSRMRDLRRSRVKSVNSIGWPAHKSRRSAGSATKSWSAGTRSPRPKARWTLRGLRYERMSTAPARWRSALMSSTRRWPIANQQLRICRDGYSE